MTIGKVDGSCRSRLKEPSNQGLIQSGHMVYCTIFLNIDRFAHVRHKKLVIRPNELTTIRNVIA